MLRDPGRRRQSQAQLPGAFWEANFVHGRFSEAFDMYWLADVTRIMRLENPALLSRFQKRLQLLGIDSHIVQLQPFL